MNNKDFVRKILQDPDRFDGEMNEDFSHKGFRKVKEHKEKLGRSKPARQKPEHKRIKDEDLGNE